MSFLTRTLLFGLAALTLSLAVPQTASAQTTLGAVLYGTDADPFARGSADFRNRGRSERLEIQVQDVTYSNDVLVLVNGQVLAEMFLTGGRGSLELEVEHLGGGVFYYQPPQSDPIFIEAGDEIDIIDANDGTVLLVGVFG